MTDYTSFNKDEIKLFKQFICYYSNNFLSNFTPDISLYFVHCKLKLTLILI